MVADLVKEENKLRDQEVGCWGDGLWIESVLRKLWVWVNSVNQ